MNDSRLAAYAGISISTTTVGVLVHSREGQEDYAGVPMSGGTKWHGEPAFEHDKLPGLLLQCLTDLEERGWRFRGQQGGLAVAIRQHDLTLTDEGLQPLGPAITWESNVAGAEADELNRDPAVVTEVGPVAARMLTPKAQWLLKADPALRQKIRWLLTTADWVNTQLTSEVTFGSSDGLSNAQLRQVDKQPALLTIEKAGLEVRWQPPVVHSGELVGTVADWDGAAEGWRAVIDLLAGWRVGSALGDNHAGAWGMCVAGPGRVVLSAGSSGTAVGACDPNSLPPATVEVASNRPPPLRFEYFDDALLLTMLPRCSLAWNEFRRELALGDDHAELNELALSADIDRIPLLRSEEKLAPAAWSGVPRDRQVAGAQLGIAAGLLTYAADLFAALRAAGVKPAECLLTGGLSQSEFFQQAIHAGMGTIAPECPVYVGARQGPARFQAAAWGALMAAMLLDRPGDYEGIASEMDVKQPCSAAKGGRLAALCGRLQEVLPQVAE